MKKNENKMAKASKGCGLQLERTQSAKKSQHTSGMNNALKQAKNENEKKQSTSCYGKVQIPDGVMPMRRQRHSPKPHPTMQEREQS